MVVSLPGELLRQPCRSSFTCGLHMQLSDFLWFLAVCWSCLSMHHQHHEGMMKRTGH
jgi:hypothetical protein